MNFVVLRRDAHHLRPAPGHRPHIGIGLAVLFQHETLGHIDLGDRVGDVEVEELGRPLQPFRMLCALEDLPAIGALALEHGAAVVQPVREHMQRGLTPWHKLAVVPDHPLKAVIRLFCHGESSSGGRSSRCGRGFVLLLLRRGPTPGMFRPAHESALAPMAQSAWDRAAGTILSWRPALG